MKNKLLILAALTGFCFGMDHIQTRKQEMAIGHFNVIQTAYADEAAPVVAPAPAVVAPAVIPPAIIDPANLDKEIENKAFLDYLWKSFNGWKGLGAMGLAAILTQILAAFMMTPMFAGLVRLKQPIADWMGKWKLALVCGLGLISGVCMLLATGLNWSAALTHSSTLVFAQVFFNQVWKQGTETKAQAEAKKAVV